tara:strand:- start:155 stop:475 length:321 start_codon:yes stop_codon:yes gene_type:complete
MPHYAKINNDNIVTKVIVADPDYIASMDESFRWVQTSYNNNFRKNYAGKGYTYDRTRDAFIAPKPSPSAKFVEETCTWKPHTPYPDDKEPYTYAWDEENLVWKEIE